MSQRILFNFPSEQILADRMTHHMQCEQGIWEWHRFPDGESLVRIDNPVKDKEVVVVCSLYHPDERFLPLCFLTKTLKELGAGKITLVAPYLGYMRQDKRFHDGEAVTSRIFAQMLSQCVDRLVTVDPHLHRYASLDEIYTIPSAVVPAAPAIARWVKATIENPIIIGPDEESAQWVAEVASLADAPFMVLRKERYGDNNVRIFMEDTEQFKGKTALLVDDIISSAHTMAEAAKLIAPHAPVWAVGVHGIFAGEAERLLRIAAIAGVATCNTITHATNAIDLSESLSAVLLRE